MKRYRKKTHSTYIIQLLEDFIYEYEGYQQGKDFFSEPCNKSNQKATFPHNYQSRNQSNPQTNPTTKWQEIQISTLTNLRQATVFLQLYNDNTFAMHGGLPLKEYLFNYLK
jgi:hypothetical protein